MGRILALDYGNKRIGMAITDPLGITAQPFNVLCGLSESEIIKRISSIIEEKNIEKIVLGLPLTLKGTRGKSVKKVEHFAERLSRKVSVPIIYWDERFTSVQAQRALIQMNEKVYRHKEKVDLIASVILLQSYLDFVKGSSGMNGREGT